MVSFAHKRTFTEILGPLSPLLSSEAYIPAQEAHNAAKEATI